MVDALEKSRIYIETWLSLAEGTIDDEISTDRDDRLVHLFRFGEFMLATEELLDSLAYDLRSWQLHFLGALVALTHVWLFWIKYQTQLRKLEQISKLRSTLDEFIKTLIESLFV